MIRENKGKGNPVVTEGGVSRMDQKKSTKCAMGAFSGLLSRLSMMVSPLFFLSPPFFHQEGSQPVSQVAQVGFCFLRDQFRND